MRGEGLKIIKEGQEKGFGSKYGFSRCGFWVTNLMVLMIVWLGKGKYRVIKTNVDNNSKV